MSALAVILLVGLGTYAMRSVFIVGLADRPLPDWAQEALANVAPSVIAALVVVLLTTPEGILEVGVAEVAGLAAAGLAAWRLRSVLVPLVAGMAVFWLAGALI